jgi:hypothetical protein
VSADADVDENTSMVVAFRCARLSRRSHEVLFLGLSICRSKNSCGTPFRSLHHIKDTMWTVAEAAYEGMEERVIWMGSCHCCRNGFVCSCLPEPRKAPCREEEGKEGRGGRDPFALKRVAPATESYERRSSAMAMRKRIRITHLVRKCACV